MSVFSFSEMITESQLPSQTLRSLKDAPWFGIHSNSLLARHLLPISLFPFSLLDAGESPHDPPCPRSITKLPLHLAAPQRGQWLSVLAASLVLLPSFASGCFSFWSHGLVKSINLDMHSFSNSKQVILEITNMSEGFLPLRWLSKFDKQDQLMWDTGLKHLYGLSLA